MLTSHSKSNRLLPADVKSPALLLVLSAVPLVAGAFRLLSVADPAVVTPENARFVYSPIPIAIHVISATLFSALGAFQFSRAFRLRWPVWHRKAGRVTAVAGLLTGASGLWMTVVYPIPPELQGPSLYAVRLVVAIAMMGSLAIAWSSIVQRNVARHEAFMIRAYALAQGAGTQVVVLLPWMLISGQSGGLIRDLLMTLSWLINLGVAESIIRRTTRAFGAKTPAMSQATT